MLAASIKWFATGDGATCGFREEDAIHAAIFFDKPRTYVGNQEVDEIDIIDLQCSLSTKSRQRRRADEVAHGRRE